MTQLIDPIEGAKIEAAVRHVYSVVLAERADDLDEIDHQLIEVAIHQQVIVCFFDACLKNKVLLSAEGQQTYANATAHLVEALAALNLENPYRDPKKAH